MMQIMYQRWEKLIKKKSDNVRYSVSVSDAGWQEYSANGEIAGTTGKNKAIKALTVETDIPDLNVEYTSYNKENDWQDWVNMGEETGNDKAVEAIKIKLSGEASSEYHVYYRVHAENFGWLGWAKNGEKSGTEGYAYRLEALQIKLVPKGTENPELPTPASAKKEAFIKK